MARAAASSTSGTSITTLDDLDAASINARSFQAGSAEHRHTVAAIAAAIRRFQKAASGRQGQDALKSRLADGRDPVDALLAVSSGQPQPKVGLALLAVLLSRLEPEGDRSGYHPFIQSACANLDAQECRFMPESVNLLAEWVHYLLALECYRNMFYNYRIPELRGTHTLTSWHYLLARTALATRSYDTVYDILHIPIDNIDPAFAPVTCQHHLLYHYYGGCVLAAACHYSEAIASFETAVTIPGAAASAISIDAYKKYILVSLLSTGKVHSLPKYTSSAVTSAFKNNGAVYLDFQSAFQSNERSKLREIVKKQQDIFVKDGNYGLVLQCLRRFKTQAILRLRRTYITVSMQEVAAAMEDDPSRVTAENIAAAERAVLALMRDKEIYADISYAADGSATVTFLDDPEPFHTEQTIQSLSQKISKAKALGAITQWNDDTLARSKEFLQKALKQNATGGEDASAESLEDDL